MWTDNFDPSMHGFELIKLVYHASEACADVQDFIEGAPSYDAQSQTQLTGLMGRVAMLDSSLESWETALPQSWNFRELPGHCINPLDFRHAIASFPGSPGVFHIYADMSAAWARNLCRSTRIILNQGLMQCFEWMASCGGEQNRPSNGTDTPMCRIASARSEGIIRTMAEGICASGLTYFSTDDEGEVQAKGPEELCGLRCLLFLWPLHVVASVSEQLAMSSTECWIACMTEYMYRTMGILKSRGARPVSI
jgi:hypothetical protein